MSIDKDFMESQINRRRRSDQDMYQEAFSDLLSIIGLGGQKAIKETRGAIAEILKHLGKDVPEVPETITDMDAQLEYMLRPSNTMRRRVELHGQWWKDSTGCLLASTKDGDVIALLPGKWSGYEYRSKNGETIKINKNTAKNINVDAFCFYKAFPLTKLKIKDLVMFMVKSITVVDFLFVLAAFAVAQALGMLMGPYTQHIIYDVLIPSDTVSLIYPVATFLIGMSIGSTLIGITQSVIMNKFQSKLTLSVNSAVMIRFFSLPTSFFKDYTAGELASRMGYIASLCQMIASAVLSTGLTAMFSFGYLFQMYHYAPTLVMPGMIIILVTIAFTVFITFRQQSIYKKKIKIAPKLQSLVYALFGGIQKIKVAGAEKRAFAKWSEAYSEVEKLDYSPPFILKIQGIISLIIQSFGVIVLYYFTISTGVSLTDYQAFNAAYGAIAGAIMTLSGTALQFANLGPIFEMIKPVMEQEPESTAGRKIPTYLAGNIEVNNVTFKYSDDSPIILDNLSLKVKKGEYLGIVGQTGCGKSTLMRLLLGFEKPNQGAVYYDGKDLATLDLRSVRQKIGVVMQNGTLFPGDVFSNIIVTLPWKTMDDAWDAAEMAGIKDDIKAMPMGMHTLIQEGAGGFSGGQKQRLMIARAVIAKPQILFFDEATSALDNITQHHVAERIAALNSTRIVIAHRLSTIKHCDRIIVLDKGKIVEEGSYEVLMKQRGRFYDLAIRQVVQIDQPETAPA